MNNAPTTAETVTGGPVPMRPEYTKHVPLEVVIPYATPNPINGGEVITTPKPTPTPVPTPVMPEVDPLVDAAERETRIRVAQSPTAEQVKARNLAFMDPTRLNTMMQMADKFVASGAFPSNMTPPRALVALQAGYERNMQPIEALNSFYFVNGHISMYGDTVIAMIMAAGHKITWGECNEKTASVTITRGDDGQSMSSTFTMQMALDRGVGKEKGGIKNTYLAHPESMLKYKAIGLIARFITPDALRGVSIKEDLETEPLEIIEETKAPKTTAPVATNAPTKRRSMSEALSAKKEASVAPSAPEEATEAKTDTAIEGIDIPATPEPEKKPVQKNIKKGGQLPLN